PRSGEDSDIPGGFPPASPELTHEEAPVAACLPRASEATLRMQLNGRTVEHGPVAQASPDDPRAVVSDMTTSVGQVDHCVSTVDVKTGTAEVEVSDVLFDLDGF